MGTGRDPDYADRLTEAERRTLDLIMERLGHRPGPVRGAVPPGRAPEPLPGPLPVPAGPRPVPSGPQTAPARLRQAPAGSRSAPVRLRQAPAGPSRRRSWRAPVATAAAAALVLLAAGSAPLMLDRWRTPSPPPQDLATGPGTPAKTLTVLAAAAGRQPDPAAGSTVSHRHDLAVVVSGPPPQCRVTATVIRTWVPAGPVSGPVSGRLAVDRVAPPTAVLEQARCDLGEPASPGQQPLVDRRVDDIAREWARLRTVTDGLPRYLSPRWVAQTLGVAAPWTEVPGRAEDLDLLLEKLCRNFAATECGALRWTVLVEVVASAETSQAQRAAALRLAATGGGATPVPGSGATSVPEVTRDVTGRAGVTLRVPYLVPSGSLLGAAGVPGTAELTFDEHTGALLQRQVSSPAQAGVEIAVYLVSTRTADDTAGS
ncbi:MAG TPA: hypothetical protein VFM55_17805 [Micromonosporaceae bacterium]|nr:hypothetical protein [Micromonosporaceae bacterium]